MLNYQLAEINIARMVGVNINDPVMKEFVDNLNEVNNIAETSPGFVWRLKDEANNATAFDPYQDEKVIINISVWESIEDLEHFMYKTFHSEFLKRRKEWFQKFGKAYTCMWWIPEGEFPSIEAAVKKLDDIQKNGASQEVFDFRNKYEKPL